MSSCVARRQACAGVDEKSTRSASSIAALRLGDAPRVMRRLVRDVDAARVDEQEALARPLARELLAVARHARRLVDDGGAGARSAG